MTTSALWPLAVLAAGGIAASQEPVPTAELAGVVARWADEFDAGRLRPGEPLPKGAGRRALYGRLLDGRGAPATHEEALHVLLAQCAERPSIAVGAAVLKLAGAGLEHAMFEPAVLAVREPAHRCLAAIEEPAVWWYLLDVVAARSVQAPAAQCVAALRLLGEDGRPVFRPAVERRLDDADPRVRLAAATALGQIGGARSLPRLCAALGREDHPLVGLALVATTASILGAHEDLGVAERRAAVEAALQRLGRDGWRTDQAVIDLARRFPTNAAVPALIGVLERSAVVGDRFREAVNRDASPSLRYRAAEALRALTGAIAPGDDPALWRAFWEQERDRLAIDEAAPRRKPAQRTSSSFYGIPVTGSRVAFVIDTSGSMHEPARSAGDDPRQREGPVPTRLDVAKQQLLSAVQTLDPDARYHLVSFASSALRWNRLPVPPGEASHASLTDCVSRFRAEGGTDVYGALDAVLGLSDLVYGETPRNDVDEVFLLSDGEPSGGAIDDPEEILDRVRRANATLRVRIHTVFLGERAGREFMQHLAQDNGGVFVAR